MDFLPSEQEMAFSRQVHDFFETEFSVEFLRDLDEERPEERRLYRECILRLARKGWLGIGWPEEYGGMGRSLTEQLIYYIEMYLRLPPKVINPLGVATALVAPVIIQFGSEELKKEYLPKIMKGEATFCLGYSEPTAGSDLVGLQTVAVADGDGYVINGQKAFTSAAEYADYCWLSAKTDPEAPKKNQGISLFIVDMRTHGISVEEVPTLARYSVNNVFFHDVRVPRENRVGEENQGWKYITQALSQERLGFGVQGALLKRRFDAIVEYAKDMCGKSRPLSTGTVLRHKLAQMAIELEVARLFASRLVWMMEKGEVPYHEPSMAKVFVTELEQRLFNTGMQMLGLYGQLQKSCEWAPLEGRIEEGYRYSILGPIGGGSNEIQRIIIAIAGLGLPRG